MVCPQNFSQNIRYNTLGKYTTFMSKVAIPSATLKIQPSNAVFAFCFLEKHRIVWKVLVYYIVDSRDK